MIITFIKFWTHSYVQVCKYSLQTLAATLNVVPKVRLNYAPCLMQTIKHSFKPLPIYGPSTPGKREEWLKFITLAREDREDKRWSWLHHIIMVLSGGYRWGK